MKWKEYSVLTEGVCVEAIAGVFQNLGSGGVVIEDPQAARKYINDENTGFNPQSVSPDFFNHIFVVVKAYFPEERDVTAELEESLKLIESNFQAECKLFIDEVNEYDWEDNWKKYYHTFRVGERMVVKPLWEEYQPQDNDVVINIDPGMAFGTGVHASTRFCLLFIEKYVKGGERIIDAGCGSGILSIAAAKLGAQSILAMDVDPVAVRIAKENIAVNKLQDVITVQSGDIIEAIQGRQADIVLANITAEVVTLLLPHAAQVLRPGGYFFGSGIVDSRWPAVKKELE